jgi:hypothetical protein
MRQFVESPDRSSPSMYTLLNEAIATAVTGIAFELAGDNETDEGKEYQHPYIPRLGTAATEPLKQALAAGRTITEGFVDGYVRAARALLGEDADSLGFTFSAVAIIANDALRPAAASFRAAIGPTGTADSRANWQRIEELNAAFVLTHDEAGEFADRIPDFAALTRCRGFAVMLRHNRKSRVLVVSGRDAAAVSEVIEQLRPAMVLSGDAVLAVVD